MIPLKTVSDLISKHALLEKELSSAEIDKNTFAEKSKEYADLNEVIKIAKFYISFEKNKKEIQTILEDKNSDADMIKMAETELEDLLQANRLYDFKSYAEDYIKRVTGRETDSFNVRETGKFISELINKLKVAYEVKE